ncbi:MAG: metallophosphoesterase family protein [Candidatus Marinimicrobia bacterium]|jgi:predicted phosphodiesterase|nr:metallophosphoesterase family protein [Candidatus Neomarinimicrobiota bacterium]MBT4359494.1 metallophosphoesterase family protein [Candidatus Neomarinimicrobiota bacterium]MBT4946399.1 metallophosphoesterase family protein [Candidatus Neomarinimicrobiota bacterium]MBT5268860.1 metallophosphoesterase family protein [Candidatus Neomarinimicrobiota bacterium]MBT6010405.1 metallophosphoesterase family protein [Candidatus Neomarinimicrobiota bacterium]
MPEGNSKATSFAIVTDIHGNIHALDEAVRLIEERPDIDKIICLGDNFSLGSAPVKVLHKLQSLSNTIFIRGNHDRYIVERIWEYERPTIEGMDPDDPVCIDIVANEKWTAEQIGDEGKDFIRNMKMSHFVNTNGVYVEFTHAWFGRDDSPPSLAEAKKWRDHEQLKHVEAKTFVFTHGHTHIPRHDLFGNLRVLCPGSTGLPFDEDKRGVVAFLKLENGTAHWEVERFDYDFEAALEHIKKVQPPFYKNLLSTLKYASIRNDLVE